MRLPRWWPWTRRQHPDLQAADEKVAQATQDRKTAVDERDQAKEMADWAREVSAANRFAIRLEAAYRANPKRKEQPG